MSTTTPESDVWIDVAQARKLTGYSRQHIARLCKKGTVVARLKYEKYWEINRASMLAYWQNPPSVGKPSDKPKAKQKGKHK